MTLLLGKLCQIQAPKYSVVLQMGRIASYQQVASRRALHCRSVTRCCALDSVNGGPLDSGDGGLVASRSSPPPLLTNSVSPDQSAAVQVPTMANSSISKLKDEEFLPAGKDQWIARTESRIERAIFDFRFLTLMAIGGSLVGSLLCFLKGCGFICESFIAYFRMCLNGLHTGKVILRLVEAVDVYLVGTVMLIFGMGLYGLFISNDACDAPSDRALKNTTLFGMFALKRRPAWMQISSLDALKTKLGHVIVMILLVKLFEKSKTVHISSSMELLYYSFSIFLSSASLYVLQRLHPSDQ